MSTGRIPENIFLSSPTAPRPSCLRPTCSSLQFAPGTSPISATSQIRPEPILIFPFACLSVTMSTSSSVSAVARIAYLASDVVINSLSSTGPSPFEAAYRTLSASPVTRAVVNHLPFGADAGVSLLRHRSARLLAYTALAHPQALNNLLLHLPELSSTPTVFHVAVSLDLSDALVLLSSLPLVIYSRTAQQAHDHALLASRPTQLISFGRISLQLSQQFLLSAALYGLSFNVVQSSRGPFCSPLAERPLTQRLRACR